jgi:hypothetical protein
VRLVRLSAPSAAVFVRSPGHHAAAPASESARFASRADVPQ